MKYRVFDVEANEKDGLKGYSKLPHTQRMIGIKILEAVLVHQRVANERHNEAMLEKDIVIAGLVAKIEMYEKGIK